MSALSVRVPDELVLSLEKACKATDRSKGYIVRKALERYLDNLQDHLIAEAIEKGYLKKSNSSKKVRKKTTSKVNKKS